MIDEVHAQFTSHPWIFMSGALLSSGVRARAFPLASDRVVDTCSFELSAMPRKAGGIRARRSRPKYCPNLSLSILLVTLSTFRDTDHRDLTALGQHVCWILLGSIRTTIADSTRVATQCARGTPLLRSNLVVCKGRERPRSARRALDQEDGSLRHGPLRHGHGRQHG